MAEAGGAGLRRKSEIETEFDKIVPVELGKAGRIEPRRYSALSNYSQSSVGSAGRSIPLKEKRIKVQVVPKASQNVERIDYVAKGFCCSPICHRRFAWGLCSAQAVLMLLWVTTILLIEYYWPASHFMGRFLPNYLSRASGRTRIIVFACLGSEPIVSFLILGATLVLLKMGIRWIRIFYVINTWLSFLLLIAGVHIMIFASNIQEQNVEEQLKEELLLYDDNATNPELLKLSSTGIDLYSKEDWDEIQYYFGCCGIHSEDDWYNVRNFFDLDEIEKDPLYWKVPPSCCQSFVTKLADIRNCVRYPAQNRPLIYHDLGCAKKLLYLMTNIGAFAGIQIFANWILQILIIFLMMSYYGILRYGDGTDYERSWRTFFFEFFFIFLCRKQSFKRKSNYNSEWLLTVNKTVRHGSNQNRKTSQGKP